MAGVPSDWPLHEASRILRCRPHEWHVQIAGDGPELLALHGAGASSHSFHRLTRYLPGYRMIMPDLPGQGLTRAGGGPARLGLDAMADDLAALAADQDWRPRAIIGHSAGAAVALRMAEILPQPPRAVIGINAALGPFDGFAGWLFPKLARAMAASPFVAALVTRFSANRAQVDRLLAGTGSPMDPQAVTDYQRLVARSSHVEGTLGMMAAWQLEPLLERLPQINVPCLLIAADKDRAVPPQVSQRAASRMPRAEIEIIPGFGHLVHEQVPEDVAGLIRAFLDRHDRPLSVVGAA